MASGLGTHITFAKINAKLRFIERMRGILSRFSSSPLTPPFPLDSPPPIPPFCDGWVHVASFLDGDIDTLAKLPRVSNLTHHAVAFQLWHHARDMFTLALPIVEAQLAKPQPMHGMIDEGSLGGEEFAMTI